MKGSQWNAENSCKNFSKTLDMVVGGANVRSQSNNTHYGLEVVPIGSKKELRQMEEKIERLEAEVEELSKKMEALENRRFRIGKIISLTAEILTIIAARVAIAEFIL